MKVGVLGGTLFIGRAIVEDLVGAGHEVTVIHRGEHEPEDLVEVEHFHADRYSLPDRKADVAALGLDALIDTSCANGRGAKAALEAVGDIRTVVLSSMDIYRAYDGMRFDRFTDPLPIDETSPVRPDKYPYASSGEPWAQEYEKQDVEEPYLAQQGTVCRLPIVYGERDYQRREWAVLSRIVAGRTEIPIGNGSFLISRGYVRDLATGVRLALESEQAPGEIFNLCEHQCWPVSIWWSQIVAAAGGQAELVRVPDEAVPEDLALSRAQVQHMLVSSAKAQRVLGFTHRDPAEAVKASVQWHLANPPKTPEGEPAPAPDAAADDAALAQRITTDED